MNLMIIVEEDISLYQQMIPKSKLFFSKEKKGLSDFAHISLFCDIHNFQSLVDTIMKYPSFEMTFDKIESFRVPHKEFDVLFLKPQDSPELFELRKQLRPLIQNHYEFNFEPHITLAYIKKDSCSEIEGSIQPFKVKVNKIILSTDTDELIYNLKRNE